MATPGNTYLIRLLFRGALLKLTDSDHHTMEYYEDRGGKEVKVMEITYTRQK